MGKDAHMRKDVKLGFAVGGILIAVLVVYVLVVSEPNDGRTKLTKADGGGSDARKSIDIRPEKPATATPTDKTSAADASKAQHPSQPAKWDTLKPLAKVDAPASPGAPAIPPPATSDKSDKPDKTDPFGDSQAKAAGRSPAAPSAPTAAKGGEMDWGKLLNSDQLPLSAQ